MMNHITKGRLLSRRAGIGATVAVSLLLVGCGDRPLTTMEAQSPIAEKLDRALMLALVACAVVFVLVQGAVIYMSKRFSVPAPDDDSQVYPDEEFPAQTHGNTRLEIGWTILPTVIMAIVAFFTLGLLFELDDVSAKEDRRIQSVEVVGQQWWWEFQYHLDDDDVPDIVTANELVLPVGEEIQLYVTSRDVIHSFWVPALNGKRDAMPGQVNEWTIEAGTIGRFPGECTEFCGLSHAYMEKFAVGITEADWDVWAANQMTDAEVPTDAEALAGWELFANNCASCHVINGLTSLGSGDPDIKDDFSIYDGPNRLIAREVQVAGVAPNLTHLATRSSFAGGIFDLYEDAETRPYMELAASGDLNRGDLEAWIRNAPELKANDWDRLGIPRGMTPFPTLTGEDVDNLVAFLMTLD